MNKGELIITLTGLAMQAYLCLLLFQRRSYRQFPVFFAAINFFVLITIVGVAISRNTSLYFNFFWAVESVSIVLTFLSLQEAFRSVFRNFLGIRWFRWLFPGVGLLMIGISLLRTFVVPRPAQSLFATIIINLEIGVGILEFGIFGLFIVLVGVFQLPWRQRTLGIVAGFGVGAAGSLAAFLLRSEFGPQLNPVVRIAPLIASIVGDAVWIVTFWRAEALYSHHDTTNGTQGQSMKEPQPRTMAPSGTLF